MSRFLIQDVKCGVSRPAGPAESAVVAEAKIKADDGEIFYASICEFGGEPMFFKTECSTIETQLDDSLLDDEYIAFLQDHSIGVSDYYELYTDYSDNELFPVFKCLAYVVRTDWDTCTSFMEEIKDKYADEIDVPVSDIEEEVIEEYEEE